MRKKLGNIVSIHLGPYLKSKGSGEVKYLLASHFTDLYKPDDFELSFVDEGEVKQEDLLKQNDVILAGKGQRMFAWAYDSKLGPCVPSSIFFVLRSLQGVVLGEYLAHYLNSEKFQFQLKQVGAGGTIPSIPKKELLQLEVEIPDMEKQQRVIDIATWLELDVMLTSELLEKKQQLRTTIMNRLLTNKGAT